MRRLLPLLWGALAVAADSNSTDPYALVGGGMQLRQAIFNASCLLHGCWTVDVAYTKSTLAGSVVVLYLPRAEVGPDGLYTAAFNATFLPGAFPCRIIAADASATTCCLSDFAARYRAIASFRVPPPNASCDAHAPPPLTQTADALYGAFAGLNVSDAIPDVAGLVVRLRLDHGELRAAASAATWDGTQERLELFVGLAQFAPTGSRILAAVTSQTRLTLTKSDAFTVSAFGAQANTFLSFIDARVYSVLNATQFAAVRFTLRGGTAAYRDVAVASPRVDGVAADCARVEPPCAGVGAMCTLVGDADYALYYVPFPAGGGLTVTFVVTATTTDGGVDTTTLSAWLDPSSAPTPLCAEAATAATSLRDVLDAVDLWVGATDANLSRLTRIDALAADGAASEVLDAHSLESGLLTLAVEGAPDYFAHGFGLALEDFISLHIMGDSKLAAVTAAAQAAPLVAIGADGRLAPSAALLSLCGRTADPYPHATCVYRYDVQARALAPSAFELGGGSASSFMQQSLFDGNGGAYAEALGANFSALLAQRYALDGRSRRAFWINPGFTWTGAGVAGADRFTLSQWVMVFALVTLDETARRSVGGAPRQQLTRTLQYGVDPAYVLAENLGLPPNQTATWRVAMELSADLAASPYRYALLLAMMRDAFARASVGGAPLDVGLVSVDVSGGRRSTVANATVAAVLYVITAYAEGARLDPDALVRQTPGVLSVVPVSAAAAPSAGVTTTTAAGAAPVLAIAVGASVGGAALLLGIGFAWRRRAQRPYAPAFRACEGGVGGQVCFVPH